MKSKRQEKILEFINSYSIETQEDLLSMLKSSGFTVTQATVSRDIKELRLHKALSADGKYCYTSINKVAVDSKTGLQGFLNTSVTSVVNAQNIVVIKTPAGMAQAVCAAIDSFGYKEVVGTIAGDDTIFVVCFDNDCAEKLVNEFMNII